MKIIITIKNKVPVDEKPCFDKTTRTRFIKEIDNCISLLIALCDVEVKRKIID